MNVKTYLARLDPLLENRIRLAVMSALAASEAVEFTTMRSLLDVTDGNLATHVGVLERAGYLRVRKRFVGRKPVTSYVMTEQGRKSFARHVDALELLLKGRRQW